MIALLHCDLRLCIIHCDIDSFTGLREPTLAHICKLSVKILAISDSFDVESRGHRTRGDTGDDLRVLDDLAAVVHSNGAIQVLVVLKLSCSYF